LQIQNNSPTPRLQSFLYEYLSENKLMIYDIRNGLKGQSNLAQGKRSVALGWKTGIKIVRALTFLEVLQLFRTKRYESQFRPKRVFRPDYCICADVFLFIPFTPGVAWG
jgi:hypothetical protein